MFVRSLKKIVHKHFNQTFAIGDCCMLETELMLATVTLETNDLPQAAKNVHSLHI